MKIAATKIKFTQLIIKEITIKNTENIDWEDLTTDKQGNLYIGDFGNNENVRKNLAIYKINSANLHQDTIREIKKITFNYPEQKEFPPKKDALLYDCEAFFEWNNSFYLFTKNRSKHFDGISLIYKIPNIPGHHTAALIGHFKTCSDNKDCAITSATMSIDQSKIILLSNNRIWLLENFEDKDFKKSKITEYDLGLSSQKEAICFKESDTILIADERKKKKGGNVYSISLKHLKGKS
ncbi:hypothetical protein [Flavobacterium jejuense]|uniref:hypothetical protein n=1 Tax=Flavobacterium jejuense TaxID=1544455 RepID=UPI00293BB765|nr:hypothetical protein [Flavobacterium jejuense]